MPSILDILMCRWPRRCRSTRPRPHKCGTKNPDMNNVRLKPLPSRPAMRQRTLTDTSGDFDQAFVRQSDSILLGRLPRKIRFIIYEYVFNGYHILLALRIFDAGESLGHRTLESSVICDLWKSPERCPDFWPRFETKRSEDHLTAFSLTCKAA